MDHEARPSRWRSRRTRLFVLSGTTVIALVVFAAIAVAALTNPRQSGLSNTPAASAHFSGGCPATLRVAGIGDSCAQRGFRASGIFIIRVATTAGFTITADVAAQMA